MHQQIVEYGQYVLPLGDIKRERGQYLLPLENGEDGSAALVGTDAHFIAVIASDNYITLNFDEDLEYNVRKRIQHQGKDYFFTDTKYHISDSLTEETFEACSLGEVARIVKEIGANDFVFYREGDGLSFDSDGNEAHIVRGLHGYESRRLKRLK